MNNGDLLVSTTLCSLIHFLTFVFVEAPALLQFTHLLACYTAMQYHATLHRHMRWVNWAMTTVAFIADYYYSRDVWSLQAMLWISLGSYLWSRWSQQDIFYIFAQWIATTNHISMYVWFNTLGNFNKIRV